MLSFFAVFLISTFFHSHAWPTGAGDEACDNLTPLHHGILPQNLPGSNYIFPFDITYRCQPNGAYEVLITGEEFHGFLLQARLDLTKQAIGTFSVHSDYATKTKTKDCNFNIANSLTHSSPEPKSTIAGIWTPPGKMESPFYFVGTVVKSFDTFWVNKAVKAIYPCVSTPELADKTVSNTSSPSSGTEIFNQSTPSVVLLGENQTSTGNESAVISPSLTLIPLPNLNAGVSNATTPFGSISAPTPGSSIGSVVLANSNTTKTVSQPTIAGISPTDNSTAVNH